MNGFLLIDKERGMTSFDVVRDVRRVFGMKKVGHAGTLDPLATGVLVVALGEGTKILEYLIGCDKEYEVVATFGAVSNTYDADGEVVEVDGDAIVNEDVLKAEIERVFLGKISQVPPKYSALKIGGRKACDVMRAGGDVELKARDVRIDEFKIVEYDWSKVRFCVKCSTGTYIRSLVHDLGKNVGVGAYVSELRRTVVGGFSIDQCAKMKEVSKKVEQCVISLEDIVCNFVHIDLSDADFDGLRDGKVLLGKKVEQDVPTMAFYKGKLVGVVINSEDGHGIKYRKVIVKS